MYDYPHHMWGMHWLWWIFWILLIVGAWWAFTRRTPPSGPPPETPLDRLQRRYADGEITTEEYEERRTNLLRDRGSDARQG
jgi:putative membrane protein